FAVPVESITASELRQPSLAPPSHTIGARIRRASANFWLNYLFWHAEHIPFIVRTTKWFYLWFALRYSHKLNTPAANARRIFGPDCTPAQQKRFTRNVVGNLYNFVYDVGRCRRMSREQLLAEIES